MPRPTTRSRATASVSLAITELAVISEPVRRPPPPIRTLITLAAGAAAVAVAMLAGRSDLLAALLEPPGPVRALLASAALLLGIVLVLRSADGLRASREPADLVRAVRIVFLAVAAFAAGAGWFVGSPVPIVAALVIAGVDVLETTFLLLVTAVRRGSS